MNEASTITHLLQIEIYTDGGCEPNPGVGGYGVVLLHLKQRMEASGGFRLTTNNRMARVGRRSTAICNARAFIRSFPMALGNWSGAKCFRANWPALGTELLLVAVW